MKPAEPQEVTERPPVADADAPGGRPDDGATASEAPRPKSRSVLSGVGLAALALSAVVGANLFGLRDRLFGTTPEPKAPAVSRAAGGPAPARAEPQPTAVRSQPWWQEVGRLRGAGPATTMPVAIDPDAIQWRVTPGCATGGSILVTTADRPEPLLDGNCASVEPGYSTRTGPTSIEVTADGPWELTVEQMVDVPLVEPPLPAMSAPGAVAVASGSFYRIDQNGTGTVTIFRLADGSHAVRLDDFFVTQNSDLEIELSPLPEPKTTDEYAGAPSATVAALDVTAGSLNFIVPPTVDPAQYRSVVIWCERLHSAYAAATLGPVQ